MLTVRETGSRGKALNERLECIRSFLHICRKDIPARVGKDASQEAAQRKQRGGGQKGQVERARHREAQPWHNLLAEGGALASRLSNQSELQHLSIHVYTETRGKPNKVGRGRTTQQTHAKYMKKNRKITQHTVVLMRPKRADASGGPRAGVALDID